MNTAPQSVSAPTPPRPRVGFSTFARLMGGATPAKIDRLLRQHKYPTKGPPLGYRAATEQVVEWLTSGTPLAPTVPTRPHERDALAALLGSGLQLPAGLSAARPPIGRKVWTFSGVDISMHPDLDLAGPNGAGGLKIYWAKDALQPGVARSMATLLYRYLVAQGSSPVAPNACFVWDVRSRVSEHATTATTKLMRDMAAVSRMICLLWPAL